MTQPAMQQMVTPAHAATTPPRAALDALVDNMNSEARLLEELTALMRRQRAAVAADDLQGVDDSVYGTQRVLLTLGEARRRRRSLNRLIGDSEELGLKSLERVLGVHMSDAVRTARDTLQAAALTLSKEVEMNRRVLREALAAGDDYVRAIYGGGVEAKTVYANGGDAIMPSPARTGGVLINRKA
jgi:hypothetical protein